MPAVFPESNHEEWLLVAGNVLENVFSCMCALVSALSNEEDVDTGWHL